MPSICEPLYDLIEEVESDYAAEFERAGAGPLPKSERPKMEPPASGGPEQVFIDSFKSLGSTEWVGGNSFIRPRLSGSTIIRPGQ